MFMGTAVRAWMHPFNGRHSHRQSSDFDQNSTKSEREKNNGKQNPLNHIAVEHKSCVIAEKGGKSDTAVVNSTAEKRLK